MYLAAKGGFIYSTVHYKISLSRASLDQKSSSSAFICLKIGVSQRRKCTASMEVHSRPRARGTRSHGHAKDDGGSTLLRAHTARGSENVGGREGNSKRKQVSGEENQRAASDRNSHGSLPPSNIVTQAFGVAAGDADAVLNGPLPLMLGPATPPLLARNQHPSPRENCGAAVLVRLRAGETERASLPIHK